MSGPIICARHGRTTKTIAGLCGERRVEVDAKHESRETRAMRLAIGLPPDVCGRASLAECGRCPHPAHLGGKCSTMLESNPPWFETRWCDCAAAEE